MDIPHFVYQTMTIWMVSAFLTIMNYALWTFIYKFLCRHMFSCLLGVYLGLELLSQVVALCFKFLRNCQSVSQIIVPFYFLSTVLWRVQFLNILVNLFFFFSIATLVGLNWYVVALNCISLMSNDGEHPFMCLCTIWISSLGKCLFRSCSFFIGYFCCCCSVTQEINIFHQSFNLFMIFFTFKACL